MQLAQNAVHAAMAGYTAFTVGLVNNKVKKQHISTLLSTLPHTTVVIQDSLSTQAHNVLLRTHAAV
jgi:hypothetical protein